VAGNHDTDWLLPSQLCKLTSEFLTEVYSEGLALYPFTTSVVEGRYVSDYRLPWALRYTINTLLGRVRAGRACTDGAPSLEAVDREIAEFVGRYDSTLDAGDRGLLLVLLVEAGRLDDLSRAIDNASESVRQTGIAALNLQDLSWLAWGAVRAAEAGATSAEPLAATLRAELVERSAPSGLAQHKPSRLRRDIVSFGGTVYYLRALHEYGRALDDAEARTRFERGVRSALGLQGARGEWPWMIGVTSGHALDVYPVYSVHQLAMAMLFLLPALDDGKVAGVAEAIERSYRWTMGANELAIPFGARHPFIVYRSIERREPAPKLSRFGRAAFRSRIGSAAPKTPARRVQINPEWRSYEGGWLLYAWADRPDALVADPAPAGQSSG